MRLNLGDCIFSVPDSILDDRKRFTRLVTLLNHAYTQQGREEVGIPERIPFDILIAKYRPSTFTKIARLNRMKIKPDESLFRVGERRNGAL